MEGCIISNKSISWRDLEHLIASPKPLRLSNQSKKAIKNSNQSLLKILRSDRVIYGVNTGFGKLSSVPIESKDLKKLQLNLVRSHAAGTGKPFDSGITRLTMALKILTWSKGYSGVRPKLVTLLLKMINHDILPVIPRQGSVGASGDLAPLSHVACSMIGEGMVYFNNRRISSMTAFKKAKLTPIALEAKEGLSLINGTQLSTAIAIKALSEACKVLLTADIVSAVSVEASLSTREVFKPAIHRLKKHKGQLVSAKNIYSLLDKSQIVESHKDCNKIQDPYCVRCIPHVHGASWEMFSNSEKIINNEINSVSDNPLIFPNGDVLSSGHFHAEPVAQALDALSIAMSEIGAISERRIHYFMKGADEQLPLFGAVNGGLESGFMLAHVTASSLASENKTLAHPASVDSISTSAGQEDIVSMAPWAGRSCLRIIDNVITILSIELLVASNINYRFHTNLKSGIGLQTLMNLMRQSKVLSKSDRIFSKDIKAVRNLIVTNKVFETVNKQTKISRV